MNYFRFNALALMIGFVLDLLIGDPEGWPHPVIFIGRYISFAEKKLRARGGNLRVSAVLLTVSTILLAASVTAAIMLLLTLLGTVPALIGAGVIAWTSLSCKCLAKEARGVAAALSESLEAGRKRVGRIVGRDTASLTEREIIRATVETVAENTTDGVLSPMLYLLLGGPVLVMAFKAASTLDSMVGYLDEKYRDIGWSSAKWDDVMNFIPARICGVLMSASAFLCGLDGARAFSVMRCDHANHLSPNCAWSEAAAAGALGVQLGGTHTYFGKTVVKPTIGDDLRPIETADIGRMNRLLYVTSILFCALLALIGALL